jgi:hypothetical protein
LKKQKNSKSEKDRIYRKNIKRAGNILYKMLPARNSAIKLIPPCGKILLLRRAFRGAKHAKSQNSYIHRLRTDLLARVIGRWR